MECANDEILQIITEQLNNETINQGLYKFEISSQIMKLCIS